ncbi:uncharacterized protein LOC111226446 isoform X4 [Seriola dumerili]|uniref:uncharacterized protein LOC111226446 isoform X4 n=1 Tax=Seriola dumerili TaxID=41447 RepID=UPI000BBE5913|nr:uncharacterized protein LOC111226446 isoform X4 [Seriola dumerili]
MIPFLDKLFLFDCFKTCRKRTLSTPMEQGFCLEKFLRNQRKRRRRVQGIQREEILAIYTKLKPLLFEGVDLLHLNFSELIINFKEMRQTQQEEDAPFHMNILNILSPSIQKPISRFSMALGLKSENDSNMNRKPPITDMQLERFHEHYRNQHVGKTNQHALAVIFLEGDEKTFYKPKPQFRSKGNSDNKFHVHTEQLLIQEIDEFLQPNKQSNGPRVECIVIYTYNSPCIMRDQNIDPCMYLLLVKACEWFIEYGIFTYVLFTKYWGTIGPAFFKDDEYKDLFYFIAKKHNITFQLDSTDMNERLKEIDLRQLLYSIEGKDRSKHQEEFKGAKGDLIKQINEPCTIKEHLDRGKKVIASSTFHPEVQAKTCKDLSNAWYEGIKNSAVEHLKAEITTDCRTVTVKCFLQNLESILGNRSPIKFYQIDL